MFRDSVRVRVFIGLGCRVQNYPGPCSLKFVLDFEGERDTVEVGDEFARGVRRGVHVDVGEAATEARLLGGEEVLVARQGRR